jgi:hypothetical protein
MFELTFFIPVLIVAGVWGFFLLNIAGNNRRFLEDDILSTNEKQRSEAEHSLKVIHLMSPILVIVVAIAALFLVNAFHPFIRFNLCGVALIAGGFFSTYLGWALGRVFKGLKDQMKEKDAKLCSRVFMISFMGTGILLMVIGFITCVPAL